jgi:branched-chain amino acid transport system permease protein
MYIFSGTHNKLGAFWRSGKKMHGHQLDNRLFTQTGAWIALVILASAPLWIKSIGLYPYLALEIMIWMMFALGYNLLLGQAGLPSFGHGAFLGVGAYAFGLLQLKSGAGLWPALLGAVFVAALAGALVAAFVSHRRGIYYALLTIAFGQVFWFIAIKWHGATGGEDGLLNIKRLPANFGVFEISLKDNSALYYFTFVLLVLVVVFLWRLSYSPFGRILQAVKQNEMRAAFVGHNVWLYKFLAFVISAAVAGLAGALFAMAQQSAYPNVMSLHNSGFVVMMVLIGGGLVNFWGPLIGAAFFILARDLLGAYTETWLMWYGLVFMVMVLFQPDGIAGIWQAWRTRRAAGTRRSADAPATHEASSGAV